MLTQETKRKIDSARDILVGKVPDPKAQVEQITTAMIYKFMDDMDKDAMELGGKARFFTNGFEKYAWSKLLDSKLGGHERLDLYAEAIVQMSSNPHIPQLFRDIFKDAFLPYRSPETLSLFLKEINSFTYEHSEDLGDAFEYLLSIMGSQGDAGQFRTPRHIIDFIVAVVDPKKDETILDPACGTAGFLISAYKHILKQHDGKDDPEHKEKPLTPDDKKRLMSNLFGYDISPDMVKLSKVNMYLHGFAEPKIFEYDTLSSDEKWDETYDVIMANPPFMTPKGGIHPHKRFSVMANRAEVLFVDYIKEHLRPKGRAGVIVPEGIIFQSGTAYKQLRKQLVDENYLWAVVSLPAGVFQPYSGVKTSVLFFDREIAKSSDSIVFMKISNDGYDLGAQRRRVEGDNLPIALMLLNSYKKNIASQNLPQTSELEPLTKNTISIFVPKSKIRDLGDYYLTGERYKEINEIKNRKWPMVELGKLFQRINDPINPQKGKGNIVYVGLENIESNTGRLIGEVNIDITKIKSLKFVFKKNDILFGRLRPNLNKVWLADREGVCSTDIIVLRKMNEKVSSELYSLILRSENFINEVLRGLKGAQLPRVGFDYISKINVPLPPIEVQEGIINEIGDHQKIVSLASEMTQVRGINITIDPSWQRIPLSDLSTIRYGYTTTARDNGDARFIRITDINEYGDLNPDNQKFITLDDESRQYLLKNGDVLVARTGATFGKTMIFKEEYPAVFASYLIRLRFDESKISPEFYWCFAQTKDYWDQANSLVTGGGQPQFNGNVLKNIKVPLPTLEKQKEIANEFFSIRNQLVNQNLELIRIFKKKIQLVIDNI